MSNLVSDGDAVARIQLVDELRNEVLVLDRFLDGGQARTRRFPLAGVLDVAIRIWRVAINCNLLALDLLLQNVQVKVAQGIRTETAALETPVGGDVRVVLQQLRDPGKDLAA
jgi:hypothetical protein